VLQAACWKYRTQKIAILVQSRDFVGLCLRSDFSIFQDAGRRHLGFLKFEIFNDRTAQEGRTASPYQILSKSVKLRPRYGDLAASAILDL